MLPRSTPRRGSPQSSFFNPHSPERVTATRSVALVRSVGDHRLIDRHTREMRQEHQGIQAVFKRQEALDVVKLRAF